MKRFLVVFPVILVLVLLCFSYRATAGPFIFTPVADVTASLIFPLNNYGQTSNIITNPISRTYLKFDLSSLADNDVIYSATIYLYQYGGARVLPISSGTNLYFVQNDSWDDTWSKSTGVTWGTQPAYSVLLGSNPNSGKFVGWSAWNLTLNPALLSDDIWSMVLVEQYVARMNEHDYYSREYGSNSGEDPGLRPFLALVTLLDDPPVVPILCLDPLADSVPEPSSLLLVGCGLAGLAGVRRLFPACSSMKLA